MNYLCILLCVCVAVTPPVKNVLKSRFRKTAQKNKLLESPEVEKEVKRLIREDLAAINVVIPLYLTPVCMYVYWAKVVFSIVDVIIAKSFSNFLYTS